MPVLSYFKDQEDERDFRYFLSEITSGTKVDGKLSRKLRKRLRKKFKRDTKMQASNVIDYRKFLSPVKDQGNMGSCVGFAVTALKEFQENVEYQSEREAGSNYKRENPTYDLSEQWTYWNSKKIDPWGPSVEGTSIRYALKVLHKIGCPPEKAWKYTDNKIDIGKPESWSHMIARWNTIDSYWRIKTPDIYQLLSALKNTGPVVIGVGCYEEIFRPEKDGFVPYPKQPRYCYGGHAILACGYDINKKRILFKNSWGPNWGKDGYGWFGFDYITDFCWDAWAVKDVSVTKAMLEGRITL